MSEENIRELQTLLERLGFSGKTAWNLEFYRVNDNARFHLFHGRSIGEDTLMYMLEFREQPSGNIRLDGYNLSFTRVDIPDVTIRDINAHVLKENLKRVDEYYNFFLSEGWSEKVTKEEYQRITGYMEATNATLERLAAWKEGEEVAKLLMFKYWPEVRYRQHFPDYASMESRYRVTEYFRFNPEGIISANQSYQLLKLKFMNEKNFEYLKDNVKYTGFGEGLAEALKEQMSTGAPAFHLSFDAQINKKPFSAVLSFRKSEKGDMYFFNSYHATLTRANGEVKDQAFYLNKGKGVTVKEAFNLLEGRAVYKELENKEGQKYHAWLQIDFDKRDKSNNFEMKQYHEKYGYDLKEALAKFPIRDLKEPDLLDILLSSLQKGNLQAVAFEKEGGAVRMFVEANPQYKSVNLYDNELKRVPKEELQLYAGKGQEKQVQQGERKENKKEASQKNGNVVERPKPAKTKSTKRSLGH
jgi:hypothetical protein